MIRELSFIDLLYLIAATRWTLALTAIAFVGGGLVGLAIALLRVSALAPLRWLGTVYVLVVQGTPLLAWLFVFFFGLSIFGFTVSPWIAAAASYSIYAGAFLGEIWRGCLQAIPRTQWEASDCLGLNRFQQYTHVILPQAVRIATAPTVGFMVQVVKNTSLASIIGFVELTRAGQIVNNSTFEPFVIFSAVALIYFVLCYPLSVAARTLERKAHAGR